MLNCRHYSLTCAQAEAPIKVVLFESVSVVVLKTVGTLGGLVGKLALCLQRYVFASKLGHAFRLTLILTFFPTASLAWI